ncbi:tRNA threonylcarbamoyladenosine biosynthesis protein TsaE [Methylobacterium sp. Leaf399]|uniref:tRNA (adenosine(37)-N6)-threonylcarbamoyltransferase complex ATPase subunit type 1 TsaE n=1 Tax=unclassified Methylobacterium TaxID=2615210 RepID=UPI0006FEA1DC|nr:MULTISPECIES: tRNA (adenosine(37)-N6)-threonylcarbamoyltransferase complex ATPase subunit type 1 TsaE [unclassified Methylobacterium]KQP58495.1 tRNA threonylcarbamoyladenosine biosynthesis protein TsaE [Methylobacterium sp. Leaf108]KQT11942.1 tRNA threonylcarbamoyladenosine biosynthesis protein TsaE [Methylobacterium sp. Leaf399]KQT88763.1 tRNA threonylcarbamoyladenosine biosynthesis protein TsaE [Methylobacterium sp. Leaf466]
MLTEEGATEDLGRFLSELLQPGDIVALSGGLGGGKTTLARAIIRELTGDPALDVPSPTFTLVQPYEGRHGRAIVHADLYRLRSADELVELGFDEMTEGAITLVEWPERLGFREGPVLSVDLSLRPQFGDGARFARMDGTGGMRGRLLRARSLRTLLERSGWDEATRLPMQGDASSRAYERLVKADGAKAVLMISPARADGPPVRNGKPYSAIVKLAESVHAFVAVDRGLRALGFSAPKIYGEDLAAGLLILEDLGAEPVTDANGPRPERYAEATRLLARLHGTQLPGVLPVADGIDHVLPHYDLEALLFETELLPDWYCPAMRGASLPVPARSEFVALWAEVLRTVVPARPTWTLRDYHSPNLIWLPGREGLERIGLIDFQDAVLGHPAYDVASLLQDARVDASPDLELRLLGLYARERRAREPEFDVEDFARAYAVLAAQRATKILGIFARLDRRDGKPGYLAHLPRIERYLARNLAHPALTRLRLWHEEHLPALLAPRDATPTP